jgi:hypothetical protein
MNAKKTKLCSHIIKNDTGLAPNPFHRYCTSALCTPSHVRAKLKGGDWLIGISPKSDGNRLVYAMRISQVLKMEEYFKDARFTAKKPKQHGTPIERCGDNFYHQREGKWRRLPSPFHNGPRDFDNDKGRPVFVSDHFYYFGDQRVSVPDDLKEVTQVGRGISYKDYLADQFVTWLEATHKPGRLGKPRDMPRGRTC